MYTKYTSENFIKEPLLTKDKETIEILLERFFIDPNYDYIQMINNLLVKYEANFSDLLKEQNKKAEQEIDAIFWGRIAEAIND